MGASIEKAIQDSDGRSGFPPVRPPGPSQPHRGPAGELLNDLGVRRRCGSRPTVPGRRFGEFPPLLAMSPFSNRRSTI